MKVQPIKTSRVEGATVSLEGLIQHHIPCISEGSVLAITSKIVSLCEGRIVPRNAATKEQLIKNEATKYTSAIGEYGFTFTITKNTLIPSAGIDESNGNNNYILWPRDAQATANKIRTFLQQTYAVKNIGVVITDSTCMALRRGTSGICLAHSGFNALNNYVGKSDLFGRPYLVSQSNIAGGLTAAAVLTMGEGDECTPLCLIDDVHFVQFQDRNPTKKELEQAYVNPAEDIFAPFLSAVSWKKGDGGA